MQLGDARSGKWPENIMGFAQALRRSGVPVDSSRIALSISSLEWVGLANKQDMAFALEAILVSREQDLEVFRQLFEVYFKDPQIANKLLAQMLSTAQGKEDSKPKKARVSEALKPQDPVSPQARPQSSEELEFDAAMTASEIERLRQADFNQLGAA
jgi:uncharacterized protein with von Willebrand factor type A (vWA) domain